MKRGNLIHYIQLHNRCPQSPQIPLHPLPISFSTDDLFVGRYVQMHMCTHTQRENAQ